MITVKGKWYDGRRSAQLPVVMKWYDNGAIEVEKSADQVVLLRQKQLMVRISDRLADTPRFLTFPDGSILESDDNQAIDEMLQKMKRTHWTGWVHLFESKMRYVLLACLLMLLIGVGMVKYGFPCAAEIIAASLPNSLFDQAERQTLALLDRFLFKPSVLDKETEARVRGHLQTAIEFHPDQNIRLQFRKGGKLGPNAFALPGGTIVFTDELINLAEHDDELLAILVHEIGHVVHQHGMRRMVQDSLLSFAIMALTGDASGVSELFLGLPVVLTELAYSREFERDADQYALDYLNAHEIAPHRFADILTRIEKKVALKEQEKGGEEDGRWTGYLSTHPPTPARVKAFHDAAPADVLE